MAYDYNVSNEGGDNLKEAANNNNLNIDLKEFSDSYTRGTKVKWNAFEALQAESNKGEKITISPVTILEHEEDHAVMNSELKGKPRLDKLKNSDNQFDTKEERRVITGSEMKTGNLNGEIPKGQYRKDHRKDIRPYKFIKVTSPILNSPLNPFKVYDPKHEKN